MRKMFIRGTAVALSVMFMLTQMAGVTALASDEWFEEEMIDTEWTDEEWEASDDFNNDAGTEDTIWIDEDDDEWDDSEDDFESITDDSDDIIKDSDDEDDDWQVVDDDDDFSDDDDETMDDDYEEDLVYYTVTFMDEDEVVDQQEIESGEAAEAPELEMEGYTLEWDDDYENITGDVTISAIWIPNEYTVKFNANGGKVTTKSKKVTFGEEYGKLPTPTKEGYSFSGWYTKKVGGSEITADEELSTAASHVLYARWAKATEKVAKPTISVSAKNKSMTVKVKTNKKVTGYVIEYSVNKKFTKNVKVVNSKKNTNKISKLNKGITYYVRAKSFKKNSSGKKVYSEYSQVKKVKIKK